MPFVLVLPFIVIGFFIAASRKAEQTKRAEAQRRERQLREHDNERPQPTPVRPSVQVPGSVREGPRPEERAQPRVGPRVQNPSADRSPTQAASPRAQTPRTAASPAKNAKPQHMHEQHDFCALRPDPPKGQSHPEHDMCALSSEQKSVRTSARSNDNALLNLTPEQVLRGVVFSEIFGKPKALR